MEWLIKVFKGMLIGLANIIPGVSGGTMMVSMRIYDTIIYSVNHLFKEFKKCIMLLLPFAVGMVAAILLGAFGLEAAFENFPLPTNALFIGLILGSVPLIFNQVKSDGLGKNKTAVSAVIFFIFFAIVVLLKVFEAENSVDISISFGNILLFFVLGVIASATMVIPGVSGSMILKTLGYYEPIVTKGITGLTSALVSGDWANVLHNGAILLPFGIGIIVGIFAIAKLIEVLIRKWKGYTYSAILGMVLASPIVILMSDPNNTLYADLSFLNILISFVLLALGCFIALKLGGEEQPAKK